MKVMVIVKGTKRIAEAGTGMMQVADQLHPGVMYSRIVFAGGKHHIVAGPFAESYERVSGLWFSKVESIEAAVEWARRCAVSIPAAGSELEIRLMHEADVDPAFRPSTTIRAPTSGDAHESHGDCESDENQRSRRHAD